MRRCVGCQACVLACKAENDLPENGFRDWVIHETNGKFPNLRFVTVDGSHHVHMDDDRDTLLQHIRRFFSLG